MLLGWRHFCRQWRHCYLLLIAMYGIVWALALLAIPKLENIRFINGRHPLDVLALMNDIRLMWAPVAGGTAIYALSYSIRALNTASAVAAISLICCATFVYELLSALMVIGLW
jgi:hypothetical protein